MEDTVQAEAPVVEAPAEGPSLSERVEAVNAHGGDAAHHWKLTGDLEEAESLIAKKSDVTPESSPDIPSETPETDVKTEAAPEPAIDEQPKVSETPAEKSERKRRNDLRRLRDLGRIEAELAAERRHREVLERQIAESKGAPAPPAPTKKESDTGRPRRPRIADYDGDDGLARYEEALDAYEDQRDSYLTKQVDSRVRSEKIQSTWAQQVATAKLEIKDFETVAFNEKTPASDVMIAALQSHDKGAKIAYYLGQHPEEAAKITQKSNVERSDPYQLGRAEAFVELEFNRISELLAKPKVVPSKETIARQPKPTGDVAVQGNAGPVDDELADAIKRQDVDAYRRIMNKREMQELGRGA